MTTHAGSDLHAYVRDVSDFLDLKQHRSDALETREGMGTQRSRHASSTLKDDRRRGTEEFNESLARAFKQRGQKGPAPASFLTLCAGQNYVANGPELHEAGNQKIAIWYPTINGEVSYQGVVLFTHGQVCISLGDAQFLLSKSTAYYLGFAELFDCLLKNGFAVVSLFVPHGESVDQRVSRWLTDLGAIKTKLDIETGIDISNAPIVLMGHSRGGQTAAVLAQWVNFGFSTTLSPDQIKAVVALSPSSESANLAGGGGSYVGFAFPYLAIVGELDADVGYSNVFRQYSLIEHSMFKVIMSMEGVLHGSYTNMYSDGLGYLATRACEQGLIQSNFDNFLVSLEAARWVANRIVTMFCRWWVNGEDWGAYFRNQYEYPLRIRSGYSMPALLLTEEIITSQFLYEVKPADYSNIGVPGTRYRVSWDESIQEKRVVFMLSGSPPPGSSILIDFVFLTNVVDEDEPLQNWSDDIPFRVWLAATDNDWVEAPTLFNIPHTQILNAGDPQPNRNVLTTFSVPLSEFGASLEFLSQLTIVMFEFDSPRGDILIYALRFV